MSRIGKAPIPIAQGVTVTIDKSNVVTVKGPKAKGRTDILAIKRGDDWVFEKFDLVVDGERLDLKP